MSLRRLKTVRPLASIALFFVLGSSTAASASSICEQALSEAQTNAIQTAQRSHIVKTLSIEVQGVPRTVVLIGESHLKSKQSKRDFNELIENFDFHGVEYQRGEDLPLALRLFSLPYHAGFRVAAAVVPNLEQSSVHDLRRNLLPDQLVDLEKGSKPSPELIKSLWQFMAHVNLSLTALTAAPAGLILPLLTSGHLDMQSIKLGTTVSVLAYTTKLTLPSLNKTSPIIQERNAVMASSLTKFLEDNPDVRTIVVTTGSAHTEGLYNHLTEPK